MPYWSVLEVRSTPFISSERAKAFTLQRWVKVTRYNNSSTALQYSFEVLFLSIFLCCTCVLWHISLTTDTQYSKLVFFHLHIEYFYFWYLKCYLMLILLYFYLSNSSNSWHHLRQSKRHSFIWSDKRLQTQKHCDDPVMDKMSSPLTECTELLMSLLLRGHISENAEQCLSER